MNFLINSPTRKLHRYYLRHRLTPAEKIIWQHLKSKQLGVWFKRQVSFGPYFLDFYCPSCRLVVEIDGAQHSTMQGLEKDRQRDDYLSSEGYHVLRFNNSEISTNVDGVVEVIYSALQNPLIMENSYMRSHKLL